MKLRAFPAARLCWQRCGWFFSAWEGRKELSRPGSGPAGPKEAPLGPAPHALVSLAMAVCICVGRGVCVAMVVLRRKTQFVFFTVVWGHSGEKALCFMAQFPWAKAALAAEVCCQEA